MMQRKPANSGLTLIELMVVLSIVAILSAIAYPSYLDYMRRGRRTDGQAALMAVEAAQARWRVTHAAYTTTLGAGGLDLPASSDDGFYTIAITQADATSYSATATPVGAQAGDSACSPLRVDMNLQPDRAAGRPGQAIKRPEACWKN